MGTLAKPVRQAIAVVISLCLAGGGFPVSALAGEASPDALKASLDAYEKQLQDNAARDRTSKESVLAFLKGHGVFKDEKDPVYSYLVNGSKLSPMGEVLYAYLKSLPNPAEEVDSIQEQIKTLRESGPSTEKKRQVVERIIGDYNEKFGKLSDHSGSLEDLFRYGTLREAVMTGAAVVDAPKKDYAQIETPDGWELWDKEGLAYKLNKNQVTTYNRDLQRKQRAMNQSRPPQCPQVPETGRYNHEMLQYSYYRLQNQYNEFDRGYHIDRMIAMAELLGKQYKDDMWFTDLTLEADLERWARKKTFKHKGLEYSVFDIVEAKLKGRVAYMAKAKEGLDRFQGEMDRMKGLATVNESRVQTLQAHEFYVVRFLSLSFLEAQKYHVKAQLERLDPKSPDSEMIDKAILEAPLDDATKQRYQLERVKLYRRVDALMKRLRQVQDVLLASDYAGNLDLVTAALNAGQKDLAELSLDYSLFCDMPALLFMSKAQLGEVKLDNLGGWAVKAYWKSGIHKSHTAAMNKIDGALGRYQEAARLIAAGDYWGARKVVGAIHPEAAYTKAEVGFSSGQNGKVTENMKVAASLRETRTLLAEVTGTNQWVNAAGNYLTYAVALALAAPIMSGVMSGVSKLAGWMNTPFARMPVLGLPLKAVEETAMHVSLRLDSLNPAAQNVSNISQNALINGLWRYGAYSGVRFVNAALRQLAFTATAGTISAAFTAGGHLWDKAVPEFDLWVVSNDKDHSVFDSTLEAAGVGFKGGVVWANESWHPLLGYIGLPSSIYEGTVLSYPMEVIGSQGAVGSMTTFAAKLGVPISEKLSLGALQQAGMLGTVASFGLGMADNLAKFALFSNAVGKLAETYSWYSSRNEPDIERRIKTARRANETWANSPVWLALPVYPAKYQAMAADQGRNMEGVKQYDEAGRRAEYLNAPEGTGFRMLKRPKVPVWQMIFEARWLGEPNDGGMWHTTKQIRREGFAKEIVEAVGGPKAKPGDVNPLELFKVSQMPDGKTIGKLYLNDEVRLVAGEKFIEALAARPGLVEKVLAAKPGEPVAGFGNVTPSLRREVALAIKLNSVKGVAFTPEAVAAAEALMKPYFEADAMPKPAGKAYMDAVRANTNLQSPALEKAVEDMWVAVKDWKDNSGNKASPMYKKGYMDLVADLKAKVETLPDLTPAERTSMKRLYEYFEAVEGRFNAFNRVGVVHELATESLASVKAQYANNKPVAELVASFEAKVKAWRAAEASADAPAVGSKASKGYRSMLAECMSELHARKASLAPADFDAVRGSLKEMEAAPWAVHDSKGQALSSWRPEQFEAMMTSMGLITLMGRGGTPVQEFLLLKTGGGKTMLVFEGLLPIAEADAAYHKMSVTFLTVQSNLEAQARLEYNAYKKVASKIEFMTYEEFKSKIAEKKLTGGDIVKKHWVFGDEGDGAALQPMLTIGETTAQISKTASAYRLIEQIQKSIETKVGKGSIELAEGVKGEVQRAQSAVEGIDARTPEGASLRRTMGKLLKAADQLAAARSPEEFALAKADIEGILRTQQGSLDGAGPLKADAKTMAKLTANAERLLKLADTIERARSPEVVKRSAEQAQVLLKQQQALIDEAGLSGTVRGSSIKSATESLRARLSNAVDAEAPMISSQADWAKTMRQSADVQRQALSEQPAMSPEALGVLRELQGRVMERLSAQPGMDVQARTELLAEVQKALGQQRNLMGLLGRDMKTSVADVWSGAAKEKAAIGARMESIDRELAKIKEDAEAFGKRGKSTAGLESRGRELAVERASLESRLKLYERFSGGAPDLAEGRAGAKELKATALRRTDVLTRAIDETQARIAKAKADGKAVDGLEGRVETLQAELAAAQKDLALAQGLSVPTKGDFAAIQKAFADDGLEIMKLIKEGKAGWESQAMERLAAREKMLRSFGQSDNPIYEVYRTMKKDMYSVAYNSERLSDDAAVAEHAAEVLQRKIDGQSLTGLGVSFVKNLVTGESMKVEELGLTRIRGYELLKAVMSDPVMPQTQKLDLFWNIVPSLLWPKGPSGKGGSWVRNELVNLARGYFDNPGNMRVDNITHRINIIHNGQWFDSMDTPTRRWGELEVGLDLTLPYKHKTLSTIKDITSNKKARFVLMSGTAGQELRRVFEKGGMKFGGSPSKAPENVGLELTAGPSEKFSRIREAIMTAREQSRDRVVVKPGASGVPEPVKAYFEQLGIMDQNSAVVQISEAPTEGGVRGFLREMRAKQGNTGLTVLSVSDTRTLREIRKYLIKTGTLKEGQIAQVFSDAEWLRENRPQAQVEKQTGIKRLDSGEIELLALDTRTAGRGLDLNFKGDRENPDPKAFKGYTNYEMLIVDPQEMSYVHELQSEGRIDVARVLPMAYRNFTLLMDVRSLETQPVFREMVRKEAVFKELRADPEAQAYANRLGRTLDWPTIHEYIQKADIEGLRGDLVGRYNQTLKRALDARQLDVELEQLNSSSVGEKSVKFDPKYRGLELVPGSR